MGQSAGSQERKVAFVKCAGTCENASNVYEYYGIKDCTMANLMQDGGQKGCSYGCLGFGSCVKACPFDAIHVENGIAVVDKEACKACGKCIEACPKKLIELIPYKQKTFVQCSSHDKGKALMSVCKVGCIGCKLCERSCEAGAITVLNGLAHIDADKCTNCGVCAEKCPRKIIIPRSGSFCYILPPAKSRDFLNLNHNFCNIIGFIRNYQIVQTNFVSVASKL